MTTTGRGDASPLGLVRPQPLGALPWPAGMLVLPDVDGAARVAAALVVGSQPPLWPEGLRFAQVAPEGDPEGAARLIAGDDPVARYNRAVLLGGVDAWDDLDSEADVMLAALVATARFSQGLTDEPPPPPEEGLDGEFAAMVRSARASAALERGDPVAARHELEMGVDDAALAGSPILAASLRGTLADLLRTASDDPLGAEVEVDAALDCLPTTGPTELRAELLVTRALARHQRSVHDPSLLMTVVVDLQEALRTYREPVHPEAFAVCSQHLALAYLAMSMNDQAARVRVGIAVGALRAALRVYRPDTHPVAWASTQLNLANALQYLPSAHQESNLDEAVQIYEELLSRKDPLLDPIGTGRVLANQGNALGHLGVFGAARERLERARGLFLQGGDPIGVDGVDEVLASLTEAESMVESMTGGAGHPDDTAGSTGRPGQG